jgi:hypothetical protein
MPELRYAEYPSTISLDSVETIHKCFEDKTLNLIIEALTKPLEKKKAQAKSARYRDIVFKGTLEEVNQHFLAKWWTDGLAIIPPTVARVEEFLKHTPLAADQDVAILKPSSVRMTPWNIAVNGVMAGCRPEHMPVLVAAVEAMGEPFYNLEQLGSTGGWNLFFVVSGPIAKRLGLENDVGLVSRGANTVIGRALGLIRHNLAGHRPGEVYMGTFGYILPPVFAEHEDVLDEIGWKPYHVDEGFDADASTVSVCGTANWGYQMYPATSDPERLAQLLAYDVARSGSPNHSAMHQDSPRLVFTIFMTPSVARTFAAAGYAKQDVQNAVWKHARYSLTEVDFESYYGPHAGQRETHRDYLKSGQLTKRFIEKGRLPAWFPKVVEGDDATIPVVPRPEQLSILVCGDSTRNKSMTFYTMYNAFVTKAVKLPANLDELG